MPDCVLQTGLIETTRFIDDFDVSADARGIGKQFACSPALKSELCALFADMEKMAESRNFKFSQDRSELKQQLTPFFKENDDRLEKAIEAISNIGGGNFGVTFVLAYSEHFITTIPVFTSHTSSEVFLLSGRTFTDMTEFAAKFQSHSVTTIVYYNRTLGDVKVILTEPTELIDDAVDIEIQRERNFLKDCTARVHVYCSHNGLTMTGMSSETEITLDGEDHTDKKYSIYGVAQLVENARLRKKAGIGTDKKQKQKSGDKQPKPDKTLDQQNKWEQVSTVALVMLSALADSPSHAKNIKDRIQQSMKCQIGNVAKQEEDAYFTGYNPPKAVRNRKNVLKAGRIKRAQFYDTIERLIEGDKILGFVDCGQFGFVSKEEQATIWGYTLPFPDASVISAETSADLPSETKDFLMTCQNVLQRIADSDCTGNSSNLAVKTVDVTEDLQLPGGEEIVWRRLFSCKQERQRETPRKAYMLIYDVIKILKKEKGACPQHAYIIFDIKRSPTGQNDPNPNYSRYFEASLSKLANNAAVPIQRSWQVLHGRSSANSTELVMDINASHDEVVQQIIKTERDGFEVASTSSSKTNHELKHSNGDKLFLLTKEDEIIRAAEKYHEDILCDKQTAYPENNESWSYYNENNDKKKIFVPGTKKCHLYTHNSGGGIVYYVTKEGSVSDEQKKFNIRFPHIDYNATDSSSVMMNAFFIQNLLTFSQNALFPRTSFRQSRGINDGQTCEFLKLLCKSGQLNASTICAAAKETLYSVQGDWNVVTVPSSEPKSILIQNFATDKIVFVNAHLGGSTASEIVVFCNTDYCIDRTFVKQMLDEVCSFIGLCVSSVSDAIRYFTSVHKAAVTTKKELDAFLDKSKSLDVYWHVIKGADIANEQCVKIHCDQTISTNVKQYSFAVQLVCDGLPILLVWTSRFICDFKEEEVEA